MNGLFDEVVYLATGRGEFTSGCPFDIVPVTYGYVLYLSKRVFILIFITANNSELAMIKCFLTPIMIDFY